MTPSTHDPQPPADRRRVLVVDTVIVCLLMVPALIISASGVQGAAATVSTVLALAAVCSLALRRLHPEATVVVIGICGAVVLGLCVAAGDGAASGEHNTAVQGMLLATIAGVYAVAAYGRPWAATAALCAALAGGVTFTVTAMPADAEDRLRMMAMNTAFVVVLLVGTWSMGRVRRSRLREVRILAQRNRALQAEKEVSAERAAAAERNRIAREMHDIVAHSLSAVIAQADGGRYAVGADPEAGRRALEAVSATSRDALSDMRGLLGVLRGDEPDDGRAPLGVRDIPALVDTERGHGAEVTLTESGELADLPPSMGLAVYRIVQEALTNARLHGGSGTRSRVYVTLDDTDLTVVVEDTAPPGTTSRGLSAIPSGGRGILGMRERAAIHGGTLDAHKTAGGFRVVAVIPIPADDIPHPQRGRVGDAEEAGTAVPAALTAWKAGMTRKAGTL